MLVWGPGEVSACMSGTRGSGVLSSTGDMDDIIGFGLYQSCGDRGSVGHVAVFWLR